MVPEPLRKEAYALLRLHRHPDVPYRSHPGNLGNRRKTHPAEPRPPLQASNRATPLLPRPPGSNPRLPALPRRLHLRDDLTKWGGTESV